MVDKNLLRSIPSVDTLLNSEMLSPLCRKLLKDILLLEARELLEGIRKDILSGSIKKAPSSQKIGELLEERIKHFISPSVRKVINATGIVIHTNLGRSVLPAEAIAALSRLENGFINLEYDLTKGERGNRDDHVEELLCRLTGAEAALLVNNNAAALLLSLNTLAEGREVVCSRGEFIEIGGSFRLPDVIKKSGSLIKAVGTTNRTHISDYAHALTHSTGCFLKVHPSNYRIMGFSSVVGLKELVALASQEGVPVVEDLGSGALVDLSGYGLPKDPVVKERVAQGADVVTFSGDKLLGGPQAGIVVGKREHIEAMNRNPLKRALRCGRLTVTDYPY
jgi:L-seryl-tRNA(Ser) seleniumtransferase